MRGSYARAAMQSDTNTCYHGRRIEPMTEDDIADALRNSSGHSAGVVGDASCEHSCVYEDGSPGAPTAFGISINCRKHTFFESRIHMPTRRRHVISASRYVRLAPGFAETRLSVNLNIVCDVTNPDTAHLAHKVTYTSRTCCIISCKESISTISEKVYRYILCTLKVLRTEQNH